MQSTRQVAQRCAQSGANIEQWQTAISAGNCAFAAGDDDSAQRAYLYGLSLARALLARRDMDEQALAALVTTYHQLAGLHRRAGRLNIAADQLCLIHQQLAALASSEQGNLRWLAQTQLRRSQVELKQFVAAHAEFALFIQERFNTHRA